ncbi:uncharacterized protein LOC111465949 [Cucurbita maxima]|uniref:Uncharacterized protein LOC111465949 n=1 Tax=Cucurbita maxima TaxID=3661 RepID=A0A6J1HNQ6_CUCMA|nr:uncharacterized protein LOC111465949 [Cucurbita maxima]XP_022966211.1 uncharacterized protein LOC111465949 [Cucurbita maxima]
MVQQNEITATMETTSRKHLSSVANDVIQHCALIVGSSVEGLVEEFETSWKPETGSYSRKFLEFCSAKALADMCRNLKEDICNGSFSRFSFDMMLAWEMPSTEAEESREECVAKMKEEKNKVVAANVPPEQDEIPLFYSDLMPLLVDDDPDVGEDAFVWLGTLVPLVSDLVNTRSTFETLTAPTGHRLHFPAYDKFLKEIEKCINHLQKQATPKGVELRDDEFILHVEGTASSQRVVRHIGSTSWPGRLTLTNYSLYFEASGVITYEKAVEIELSRDTLHSVKPASTGPWGAPLFDKAIFYESPEISEEVVLEFPEITSSTRRDHWLALIKEIILLHCFLRKFNLENPMQVWEIHSRTILGIIRLHAARELLRISPPVPTKFLIFALCDELPKGDYVLKELAENLKLLNSGRPCNATATLRYLNMSQLTNSSVEEIEKVCNVSERDEAQFSLENAINQAREKEKEVVHAKATTVGLKEEGIGESALIFMELLKPLKSRLPWFKEVLEWERPAATVTVLTTSLIITFKEWLGKAVAALLFWVVLVMLQARKKKIQEKCDEIVVCTASDQTTMESIVSAQQSLQNVHEIVQAANIAVLKIWSIFISKTRKHADMVMAVLSGVAIILAVVPTKYIIMGAILYGFLMTSRVGKKTKGTNSGGGDRRLKEWWDSIPVIRVRVVDKLPESGGPSD